LRSYNLGRSFTWKLISTSCRACRWS